MCGITGFYNNSTDKSRSELNVIGKAMIAAISHRGPDSHGIWQDQNSRLLLGHQRLAILDLSAEGHQPMLSDSERYVIVYNGEIYNYLSLQKILKDYGIIFKGRSDTEVILASIEHWGLNETIQKLNGMFAFALWDKKQQCLHLVRDRLGKKPLYVGWTNKSKNASLVFGSELKSLRAHHDFQAELNREATSLFMEYGYVPAPYCIYQNVWSVPAGFRLTIDLQSVKPNAILSDMMQPYWHHLRALEESKNRASHKTNIEIIKEFEELLTTCVNDRMISDVPIGAFLSGGIDSSAVVALMQKISSRPVKTYSIGFEEDGFNEAVYAKKVAAHLGTDHHELYINGQDALNTIPLLPEIYDEPFADISAIPTYLVSKFAQRDVTVVLSGDGGDEMLGGYNRHIVAPKIWKRAQSIPRPLRQFLSNVITKIPTKHWDALVKNQPQFGTRIHKVASIFSLNTPDDIYRRLIQQWSDSPVLDTLQPHTLANDPLWIPQNLSFTETMMYRDSLSYLPNNILVKIDRASMAASIESRAPLLDKRIYEYVWTLPENVKIRNGRGKWLLRQVLKNHVPTKLFERPKQGFAIPVGEWLRDPLKDWAETLLDEQALKEQGIFDHLTIRSTWEDHLNGNGNHSTKLWNILMFQAWQEKWL